MTDEHESHKQSSTGGFFSGLVFGATAGALGYFFMKTKEGDKVKKKLKEEWEKAKHDLAAEGIIPDASHSLPQMVQHTIEHIISPQKTSKKVVTPAKKSSTKKKSTVKRVSEKKFSGVKK